MRGLVLAVGAAACAAPADVAPDGAPAVPTYYRDVAPLLDRHCAACHAADGVAPIRLDSYDRAARHALLLDRVVDARVMPPWPADASGACGDHVESRWLDDRDLATIAAWVAAGAPRGDPASRPSVEPPNPPVFTPTAVLDPGAAYRPDPAGDDYRCFVLDPALDRDQYLTAFAVRPDANAALHHVQLWALSSPAAATAARQLDAEQPGPGYECRHGPGVAGQYVGVWAPGQAVHRYPDGTGMRIPARQPVIVQYHYHGDPTTDGDRTRVQLELVDAVDHPLRIRWVRNAAMRLPPGVADAQTVASTFVDGDTDRVLVWGARIHMHQRGVRARLEVAGSCLLDIPRWQYDWQLMYRLTAPRAVAWDSELRVTCTYDTRGATGVITWGTGDDQEMCIGYALVSDE